MPTLLIVSGASPHHTSGVQTMQTYLMDALKQRGWDVHLLHPETFPDVKPHHMPWLDPNIQVFSPFGTYQRIAETIQHLEPDFIFIVTEEGLGRTVRRYCLIHNLPFITAYTTQWDDYIQKRWQIPGLAQWAENTLVRPFHVSGKAMLVATRSMQQALVQRGYKNSVLWTRGVDLARFYTVPKASKERFWQQWFHENDPSFLNNAPDVSSVFLYVGRVSVEKELETFFNADLPGTKVVVGPESGYYNLHDLCQEYPHIYFTGPLTGQALTDVYAHSDVFFFPSRFETFGQVVIEALASGLPVVAYNTTGPKDILEGQPFGFLGNTPSELEVLAHQALDALNSQPNLPDQCREYVTNNYSLDAMVQRCIDNLVPIDWTSQRKTFKPRLLSQLRAQVVAL